MNAELIKFTPKTHCCSRREIFNNTCSNHLQQNEKTGVKRYNLT